MREAVAAREPVGDLDQPATVALFDQPFVADAAVGEGRAAVRRVGLTWAGGDLVVLFDRQVAVARVLGVGVAEGRDAGGAAGEFADRAGAVGVDAVDLDLRAGRAGGVEFVEARVPVRAGEGLGRVLERVVQVAVDAAAGEGVVVVPPFQLLAVDVVVVRRSFVDPEFELFGARAADRGDRPGERGDVVRRRAVRHRAQLAELAGEVEGVGFGREASGRRHRRAEEDFAVGEVVVREAVEVDRVAERCGAVRRSFEGDRRRDEGVFVDDREVGARSRFGDARGGDFRPGCRRPGKQDRRGAEQRHRPGKARGQGRAGARADGPVAEGVDARVREAMPASLPRRAAPRIGRGC